MVAEHWAILQMLLMTCVMGWIVMNLFSACGQLGMGIKFGLSFPVGMATISLVCFVLGVFHVPLVDDVVKCAVIFFEIVLFIVYLLKLRLKGCVPVLAVSTQNQAPMSGWQKVGAVCLGLYLVYQFYLLMGVTLIFPINTYDAIAVTALKSKIFYYDSSMQALRSFPVPSYPLMVPLEMLWLSLNIGRWDDTLVKLVFPLTALSFMAVQYFFMRELRGIFWALLYCALTISSAFYHYHATIAYQDFLMMVFYILPFMIMLMCVQRKDVSLMPLAGLCAGLGFFVKLEGFLYFVINLALCLYLLRSLKDVPRARRFKALISYLWPGVLIYCLYTGFVSGQGFAPGEGRLATKEMMSLCVQLLAIAGRYVQDMFLSNNWNMLWSVLAASLLVAGRLVLKSVTHKLIFLMMVLTFVMFIAIDLFTVNPISHPFILSRLLLHFYPVLPLWIVLLHADFIVDKPKNAAA